MPMPMNLAGSLLFCYFCLFVFSKILISVSSELCFFLLSDAPQVKVVLGWGLNASNVKEGDDVYFDCLVKASPPPSRVGWKKEVKKEETRKGIGIKGVSPVI